MEKRKKERKKRTTELIPVEMKDSNRPQLIKGSLIPSLFIKGNRKICQPQSLSKSQTANRIGCLTSTLRKGKP
jgi:hypothetical protein